MEKIVFKNAGVSDCDSFPLGNGDIGITLWAEENGKVSFYISKTDSFSSNHDLLKIGRVNINVKRKEKLKFKKHILDMEKGLSTIYYDDIKIEVFVDKLNPCIRINASSKKEFSIDVKEEIWRKEQKQLNGTYIDQTSEYRGSCGQDNIIEKVITYPDVKVTKYKDATMWYHKNLNSHYESNLKHQDILEIKDYFKDPLLNRTFGACILEDSKTKNIKSYELSVGVLTKITKDTDSYIEELYKISKECKKITYIEAKKAHISKWLELNEKSYISISSKEAKLINSGYNAQRYMNLCAGEGALPIKFNGSIFNVNRPYQDKLLGPDFRMWGGCYWFQNTRLIYWNLLKAGDFNCLKPFFDLYDNAYDIAKAKVKECFGFDGVLYPETMTMWATHRNIDYRFNRVDGKRGISNNSYLKYYFSGMLELVTMMIDYYKFTKDESFKDNTLEKIAIGVLDFYFNFYDKRDKDNKIIIYPSQALETWQDAKNPSEAIAGITHVINELEKIEIKAESLNKICEYKNQIPPIPMYTGFIDLLKPAQEYDFHANHENPELYAVFPYRLFSFEKENNQVGVNTFNRRRVRDYFGWTQDGIQAAMLGLTNDAKEFVETKFSKWDECCKFQGYFGPNYDWTPDQDHGTSASTALISMLIQCDGDKIYIFPAWPLDWDVKFKLPAYNNTTVSCELKKGKLINLEVFPISRKKDIEIALK